MVTFGDALAAKLAPEGDFAPAPRTGDPSLDTGTDAEFLTAAYLSVLGRPPDAPSERDLLLSLAAGNVSRASVVCGLWNSEEASVGTSSLLSVVLAEKRALEIAMRLDRTVGQLVATATPTPKQPQVNAPYPDVSFYSPRT